MRKVHYFLGIMQIIVNFVGCICKKIMVGEIIRGYMERGAKKLTVPSFGTFMRKETGEIILVDLLRSDDGVLSELVEDYGHYSEVEAMALIDRFIFDIRRDMEQRGSHTLEGFGVIARDENGTYRFRYTPATKSGGGRAVQEDLFNAAPDADKTVETPRTTEVRNISATPVRPVESKDAPATPRPPVSKNRPVRAGRRPDVIIIIAIVAAVIAALVLYFGFSTGNMPFMNR